MENYVSVRVERIKAATHRGQRDHDLRLGKVPEYVDTERSHLNSVLRPTKTAAVMQRRVADLRSAAGLPARKMAVASIRGIITFSTNAQKTINDLTREQQDSYFAKAAQAAAKHFNTDLASLVVHRDESAPHAHFSLPAVNSDGQPLSYSMGKGQLSALQDSVGAVFAPLSITRGKKLGQRIAEGDDYSKTIHRSVRQLHADLPGEIEALQEKRERAEARVKQTEALIAKRIAQGNDAIIKQQERFDRQQEKLDALIAESERLERLEGDLSAREARGVEKEGQLRLEAWRERKTSQKAHHGPAIG